MAESRVVVDEYLMATKNIFAIGDCADTRISGMALQQSIDEICRKQIIVN